MIFKEYCGADCRPAARAFFKEWRTICPSSQASLQFFTQWVAETEVDQVFDVAYETMCAVGKNLFSMMSLDERPC
jgi:hypothetical protein